MKRLFSTMMNWWCDCRRLIGRRPRLEILEDRAMPASYIGTSGPDNIRLGTSDDYAEMREGNDIAYLGNGNDTAYGNQGDDQLYGEEGNDQLHGGKEQDLLSGGPGADRLYGELGNDRAFGDDGPDYLDGGDGDDTLDGGNDPDIVYGGSGNDNLQGGPGADQLFGGDGNDFMRGGKDADTLEGGAGADEMYGDLGDDMMQGNTESDRMFGGPGRDTIRGGQGDDYLEGNEDDDELYGDLGDDSVLGNTGNDRLFGGPGRDFLHGGQGDDYLEGNEDDDELHGGLGNDSVLGNMGNDLLFGEAGDDVLHGGKGDDSLDGGDGNDQLWGDLGNNRLFGGAGADRFVISPDPGKRNVVEDFDPASGDRIQICGFVSLDRFEQLRITQSGSDALIDAGEGRLILVRNFSASNLSPGNVLGPWSSTVIMRVFQPGAVLGDKLTAVQVAGKLSRFVIAEWGGENAGNANPSRVMQYVDLTPFRLSLLPALREVNGSTHIDLGGGQRLEIAGVLPAQLAAAQFLLSAAGRAQAAAQALAVWPDAAVPGRVTMRTVENTDRPTAQGVDLIYLCRPHETIFVNNDLINLSGAAVYALRPGSASVVAGFRSDGKQFLDVSGLGLDSFNQLKVTTNGTDSFISRKDESGNIVAILKDTPVVAVGPSSFVGFRQTNKASVERHDYVMLSRKAYDDQGSNPGLWDKELASDGWKPLAYSATSGTGFRGSAFYNVSTGQIVIACRGTDFKVSDGGLMPANLVSDIDIATLVTPKDIEIAGRFYDEVVTAARQQFGSDYSRYQISTTGHSLGGFVAQYLGISRGVPATTFDSPGVAQFVRAKFGAAYLAGLDPNMYETILFKPYTLVGSPGEHFGITLEYADGTTAVSVVEDQLGLRSRVVSQLAELLPGITNLFNPVHLLDAAGGLLMLNTKIHASDRLDEMAGYMLDERDGRGRGRYTLRAVSAPDNPLEALLNNLFSLSGGATNRPTMVPQSLWNKTVGRFIGKEDQVNADLVGVPVLPVVFKLDDIAFKQFQQVVGGAARDLLGAPGDLVKMVNNLLNANLTDFKSVANPTLAGLINTVALDGANPQQALSRLREALSQQMTRNILENVTNEVVKNVTRGTITGVRPAIDAALGGPLGGTVASAMGKTLATQAVSVAVSAVPGQIAVSLLTGDLKFDDSSFARQVFQSVVSAAVNAVCSQFLGPVAGNVVGAWVNRVITKPVGEVGDFLGDVGEEVWQFLGDPFNTIKDIWGDLFRDKFANFSGTAGADLMFHDADRQRTRMGDGDDVFFGWNGWNVVFGENGDDILIGGSGTVNDRPDELFGGPGNDYLSGLGNRDDLYGGAGRDTLLGGDGDDKMWGGDRPDVYYADQRNTGIDEADWMEGGAGNDLMYGQAGNDYMQGNTGQDKLYGGDGGDTLRGGQDADELYGEAGPDQIYGDRGDDLLAGGSGADVFYFAPDPNSTDRVMDFSPEDRIDLSAFGWVTPWSMVTRTQVGKNTELRLPSGQRVVLLNTLLSSLMPKQFVGLSAAALIARADEHESAGRLSDAIYALNQALQAGPPTVPMYERLAGLYDRTGRPADAAFALRKAVELVPTNSLLLVKLGEMSIKAGKWDDGCYALLRAVEIDGSNATGFLALSRAYLLKKRGQEAAYAATRAAQLDPKCVEAFDLMNQAYTLTGQRAEAEYAALRAKELRSASGR